MKIENSKRSWLVLLICSCGSGWLYRIVIHLAPGLTSAEPSAAGEVLPWVRPITHHAIQTIQSRTHGFAHLYEFMACCAGLFLLYGAMLWAARGITSGRFLAAAVAAAAVFRAMLLCSPVMLSFDAYAYAHYGRLVEFYSANAYATPPASSLTDPFLCHGLYQWGPSWYGPVWTAISAAIAWLGAGHVGLTLLIFRGLAVVASLLCGLLIWLILKKLRPDWAASGALLFLWNPLLVMESALSGHNDACMMALALLAVWLHLRGMRAGAVVALAASALVKVITAPLIPLYILMILRQSAGWRERGWFLARAAAGALAMALVAAVAARMSPTGLLAHTVSSADFYKNNYHELVFRALRRRFGENSGTLNAPMDFHAWWVATSGPTMLHADTSNKSKDLARLAPLQPLMVLADKESEDWVRVYDPSARAVGFVDWPHVYAISEPPNAASDPVVRFLSVSPQDWPTVVKANRWIRLTTWGLFAAFGLLAAWKARDFESFLTWGAVYFLVAQLLVVTQIWPWYMTWPLAFGALKPASPAIRLALMLSVGLLMSYALLGFRNTRFESVYECRSLFTVVLPVSLFFLLILVARLASRLRPA